MGPNELKTSRPDVGAAASTLEKALYGLSEGVGLLEEIIGRLTSRLAPVMRATEPQTEKEKRPHVGDEPGEAPVIADLDTTRARVHRCVELLGAVESRLVV